MINEGEVIWRRLSNEGENEARHVVGKHSQFLPLRGKSFDMKSGVFTYEICPFDKVLSPFI